MIRKAEVKKSKQLYKRLSLLEALSSLHCKKMISSCSLFIWIEYTVLYVLFFQEVKLLMYSPETPMYSCYSCPFMMGGQYFQQQYMEAPDAEINQQDTKSEEDKVGNMYRISPFYGGGPYPRPRPRPRPPYYPWPPFYPWRPYYPRPYYGFPYFPFFPYY